MEFEQMLDLLKDDNVKANFIMFLLDTMNDGTVISCEKGLRLVK